MQVGLGGAKKTTIGPENNKANVTEEALESQGQRAGD